MAVLAYVVATTPNARAFATASFSSGSTCSGEREIGIDAKSGTGPGLGPYESAKTIPPSRKGSG